MISDLWSNLIWGLNTKWPRKDKSKFTVFFDPPIPKPQRMQQQNRAMTQRNTGQWHNANVKDHHNKTPSNQRTRQGLTTWLLWILILQVQPTLRWEVNHKLWLTIKDQRPEPSPFFVKSPSFTSYLYCVLLILIFLPIRSFLASTFLTLEMRSITLGNF